MNFVDMGYVRPKYPKYVWFDDELGMYVLHCECAELDWVDQQCAVCVQCGTLYEKSEIDLHEYSWRSDHFNVTREDVNSEFDEEVEVHPLSYLDEIAQKGEPADPQNTNVSKEYYSFWVHGGPIKQAMKFGMKSAKKRIERAIDKGLLSEDDIEWLDYVLDGNITLPSYIRRALPNPYYHWKKGEGVVSFQWYNRITKKDMVDYDAPKAVIDVYPATKSLKEGMIWVNTKDKSWRIDAFRTTNALEDLIERAQKKGFHVVSRNMMSLCLRRHGKTPLYSRVRCQPEKYRSMIKDTRSLV